MRFLVFACLTSFVACGQDHSYIKEKITVVNTDGTHILLDAEKLYQDRWDVLPQPQFWKKIMRLSPDSCVINVASTRQILETTSIKEWKSLTEEGKELYKNTLRQKFGIDSSEIIFITTGKSDFYKFDLVYPTLSKGIAEFEKNNVDPWYAQAILLIESPGQLAKSVAGAYGAFQLMPGVARNQGLIVNKTIDERKDFARSAYAASRLIKNICIPETKKILNRYQINYKETDIWFRLMVLHVYHAGALNVAAAIEKINPSKGEQQLIQQLWQTKAASFGNNSQNYSQLALASQLILDELILNTCEDVYSCGEKELADF
jgi:hypothetical protein